MKQIYVCEKCGAQYEDWGEASRCEDSHRSVEAIEYSHLDQENADGILSEAYSYKTGQQLPSVITIRYQVYDEDNGRSKRDENGYPIHASAMYALIKPSSDQKDFLRMVNDSMEKRRQFDYTENQRWLEEYNKRQAEKKAEEEAAQE